MRAKLNGVFTGIVEELGEVVDKEELADAARFVIRGPVVTSDAGHGDSIAVNGVCLTVVEVLPDGQFSADVMAETLNRSSLQRLEVGSRVNLERAAALNSRLGGHIVQGHVDGTGTVLSRSPSEHWEVVRIALPDNLSRYVVEKGSITVDGISLTVSGLGADDVRALVRGVADPHHAGAHHPGRRGRRDAGEPRSGCHRQVCGTAAAGQVAAYQVKPSATASSGEAVPRRYRRHSSQTVSRSQPSRT